MIFVYAYAHDEEENLIRANQIWIWFDNRSKRETSEFMLDSYECWQSPVNTSSMHVSKVNFIHKYYHVNFP